MTETWLIIGISGVTCGGKTTLADSLFEHFKNAVGREIKTGVELRRVEIIKQDNYFLPVDDARHVLVESLNHFNWEILSSIDMDLMSSDIMKIIGKKFLLHETKLVQSSTDHFYADHLATKLNHNNSNGYSDEFMDNKYTGNCNYKKIIKHNSLINILLIEGFLIFNHPVTLNLCNIKYHLHLPFEKCCARRLERDYEPPDVVGYFEAVVWPAYEQHFEEFRDREDIVILNGDISKKNCFDYVLKSILNEISS